MTAVRDGLGKSKDLTSSLMAISEDFRSALQQVVGTWTAYCNSTTSKDQTHIAKDLFDICHAVLEKHQDP